MAAGQHDTVLHLAEAEVDDAVKEERASGRACEARRDELGTICQWRFATGTQEEA